MHEVALLHTTEERLVSLAPTGLGMLCCVHTEPFQLSAKAVWPPTPSMTPTATHAEAEVQETSRSLLDVPPGFGVFCTVHAVPFQCAASVPPSEKPTAVQSTAVRQATRLSS